MMEMCSKGTIPECLPAWEREGAVDIDFNVLLPSKETQNAVET